jgi:hypothetical protein
MTVTLTFSNLGVVDLDLVERIRSGRLGRVLPQGRAAMQRVRFGSKAEELMFEQMKSALVPTADKRVDV